MSLIKTRTTLKDFNNHFENDFINYKKKYIDCSKKQFINELENHYKHCLKNVRIINIPELGLYEVDNEANHYGVYIIPEIQDLYKNEDGTNELKRKNLEITFENILDQLKIKKSRISSDNNTSQIPVSKLKWQGTQTQFIELTKALIENGSVKGLQKDVIASLSQFLNIKIKNPDKTIQDIKNRNVGSETLFLNDLKTSLYNFISLEKEKNRR